MYKTKVLLVDDEYLALQLLESYLIQFDHFEILGKEKSPITALNLLRNQEVDLLFLDIQMPGLNGNDLLRSLPNPPVTIYTTAYPDYALEAFDLNVVDYLLKPIPFERFVKATNKAMELLEGKKREEAGEKEEAHKNYIAVKVDGKMVRIPLQDILYIEGLKEYVKIICAQKKFVTLDTMKRLEEILPSDKFMRVHKSYIVAIDKIQALNGNMLELGAIQLPISRNSKDEILKRIF